MNVDVRIAGVTGNPGADEVAAIIAAVEALWPRAVAVDGAASGGTTANAWRFSGRWWASHELSRRARPRR